MKKVLFFLLLVIAGFTLKAEELAIKFYLQDGNFNKYKIADISSINFIKSDTPYLMAVYTSNGKIIYDTKYIISISIDVTYKLLSLDMSGTVIPISLEIIDSINFIPSNSLEIPIGKFTWMGKNLDVEYYRNGDPIPQVTDSSEWKYLQSGAWCYYNNDPANGAKYGKLYNWYAVNDPRGLAPEGWHIPSLKEWTKLANILGGDTVAGGKMKTTGTKEAGNGLWLSPNAGATNESIFSANPGGYRFFSFTNMGKSANFWSTDVVEEISSVLIQVLNNTNKSLINSMGSKSSGFSVRCIKDYQVPIIKSISPNSSQVGKVITISGTGFGAERKDSYVTFGILEVENNDYISWSDTEIKLVIPQDAKSGNVVVWVGDNMSNLVNFIITQTDPDYFEPITIGTQVWMSRNLNVDCYRNGDSIPQVKKWSDLNNLTTGAWCYYYFKYENEEIYGKLYNWYAVNDPRGLAPEGWHVASDDEWTVLTDYLGDTTLAGGKLKTTGNLKDDTGLWKAPNFGATNESGFSALPGGKLVDNAFQMLNFYGYWWTSTESDFNKAWYRQISNMSTNCSRLSETQRYGFSVRCVKD